MKRLNFGTDNISSKCIVLFFFEIPCQTSCSKMRCSNRLGKWGKTRTQRVGFFKTKKKMKLSGVRFKPKPAGQVIGFFLIKYLILYL